MDNEACRRGCTRKFGPRVLTYCLTSDDPDLPQSILINCPSCGDEFVSGATGFVTGERAPGSDEPAAPRPLVHGWYSLRTTCLVYVQQLNPSQACDADPIDEGTPVFSGEEFTFFVDTDCHDGVIAVVFCPNRCPVEPCPGEVTPPGGGTAPPETPVEIPCNAPCFCRVTVNRLDTILPMAITKNNADMMAPEPSPAGACTDS